jgi:hypothetical protein
MVVVVDWDDIVTLLPTRHNRALTSIGLHSKHRKHVPPHESQIDDK